MGLAPNLMALGQTGASAWTVLPSALRMAYSCFRVIPSPTRRQKALWFFSLRECKEGSRVISDTERLLPPGLEEKRKQLTMKIRKVGEANGGLWACEGLASLNITSQERWS